MESKDGQDDSSKFSKSVKENERLPRLGRRGSEGKVIEESDEEEEQVTSVQYKIILCGDGAVGKTSIATRFAQEQFQKSYKQTIGLDFFIKRLVLPGNLEVVLQIWDIGGQSIGSRMIQNYIYGANAVLLCYDISNYQSFQNLEDWYRLVRRTFADKEMPYTALVANKTDLEHIRCVSVDQHNDFADENEFYSYFMSAKSGDNVKSAFHRVAADLAGVVLSRPDFQISHQVVKAEIVEHEKDDLTVRSGPSTESKNRCMIQ